MFNPFIKFEERFIAQFRKIGHRYLVSQSFSRDNDLLQKPETVSLLFSNYNDKGLAQIHYNAMREDKYAAIIDLELEKHRDKIVAMVKDDRYSMYSNTVTDVKAIKAAVDRMFAGKIRHYVQHKTNWRIGGSKTLQTTLEVTFGELFLVLKYGRETIRVTLREIEGL